MTTGTIKSEQHNKLYCLKNVFVHEQLLISLSLRKIIISKDVMLIYLDEHPVITGTQPETPIQLLFAYHTWVGLTHVNVRRLSKHFISSLPILSVSLSKKIHKKLIRTFSKVCRLKSRMKCMRDK